MQRQAKIFSEYLPKHDENLMHDEGDAGAARAYFLKHRPRNLANLLDQRFSWMAEWIRPDQTAIELGSGHGLIKEFVKRQVKITDVVDRPYIDMRVDALDLPFARESVDVFICSHMIHHVAHPLSFLKSLQTALKPGGLILIQEIYTSVVMRFILRVMRHEGWSYNVDVFDASVPCNSPADPWSANCAIAQLLFDDGEKLVRALPGMQLALESYSECLAFPVSGGVIAKVKTVQLPWVLLKGVNAIDRLLVRLSPRLFAMGRRIVLRKA